MNRPSNAPGCFGLGIASMRSEVCTVCKASQKCSELAIESLQEVSEAVDVIDYLAVHKQTAKFSNPPVPRYYPPKVKVRELDETELKMMASIPVKAREYAGTLMKKNVCLRTCLHNQRNPFRGQRPVFLELAFDLVLSRSQFNRDDLMSAFKGLNWSDEAMRSQTSAALGVFKAMQVITDNGYNRYKVINRDIS